MATLKVNLNKRKNFRQAEIPLFSGLNVLIGTNGSGKSSLMESLFSAYLDDSDKSIVGFTSGQNENFTELFATHLAKVRKQLNSGKVSAVKTLFFDRKWSSLLILLSTFLRRANKVEGGFSAAGMCSQYLLDKGYRIRDFSFSLQVPKKFFELYKVDEFQTSYFAQLVEQLTDVDANTKAAQKPKLISLSEIGSDAPTSTVQDGVLSNQVILGLSRILESLSGAHHERIEQLHYLTYFFQIASITESYVDMEGNNLEFEMRGQGVDFRHISDGEYQLLSVYAIVDLFGDEFDFILLDEVDSHVHTSAIPCLWSTLSEIKKSVVVTSTHSPISLKYIDSNRILSLKGGSVREGITKLADLQLIFDSKHSSENVLALCFRFAKQIILIDSLKDWEILIELFRRKLGADFNKGLQDYSIQELSSTRENFHQDKDSKDKFVAKLSHIYSHELSPEDHKKIDLRLLVSLKDRDGEALKNTYLNQGEFFAITQEKQPLALSQRKKIELIDIYLHRREIENYLLTESVVRSTPPGTIIGVDANGISKTREEILAHFKNEEFIANLDVKTFINRKICEIDTNGQQLGFSPELMIKYVHTLQPSEISDYLPCLHEYLCECLGGQA